jgi:hypothetical protein
MPPRIFWQRRWAAIILFLVVVVGIFAVSVWLLSGAISNIGFYFDCDERNSLHPAAPALSRAILIKETMPHDTPNSAVLLRTYSADMRPEDVTNFYREIASCNVEPTNYQLQCYGKAVPFGIYKVLIDYEQQQNTSFTVEIRWDRCSPNESISIENNWR